MVQIIKPRYCQDKDLKAGKTWYWVPPSADKKLAQSINRPFPFATAKLGIDLSQRDLDAAALPHNNLLDEWRAGAVSGDVTLPAMHGSVKWLLTTYLAHESFTRRVANRSRADYRNLFALVCELPTTKPGLLVGDLIVSSITPAAAGKIYTMVIAEVVDTAATALARQELPDCPPVMTGKYRRGEKALMYLKTAWQRMRPHYPREFRDDVPNPWDGVTKVKRIKLRKPAVDRTQVYAFAEAAIAAGKPEAAAASVICFEWLQRPENVVGGYIRWSDYKAGKSIHIEHHKTGAAVEHPLSAQLGDGTTEMFYQDAENVLAKLPKRGISMILGDNGQRYDQSRFGKMVRKIRENAGLPDTFTLDACRHGGMTELEEAELTDGQGRALSAHSSDAYKGYAKRTAKRMLAATRRRRAYVMGTNDAQLSENETDGFQKIEGAG